MSKKTKKTEPKSIISDRPTKECVYWERKCARCGSECRWIDCEKCDSTGCDTKDIESFCSTCSGYGGWLKCVASELDCINNPLSHRENVPRGQFEWYKEKENEKRND